MLDRIDMHLGVPRVDFDKLTATSWANTRQRFEPG